MNNLLIAFPEKTEEERKHIAKEFYKKFTDNFLEVLKLISISKEEFNKRFTGNFEVINDLYDSGVNVQLHSGHFFNWEYANLGFSANLRYPFVVVYMPVDNKVFNRLFLALRQKFGSLMVAATDFRKDFSPYSKQRYVLALVGDQNPGHPDNAYWATFFNKLTPIVKGPEKGARINKTAVVMCNFYPVKRGYYRTELILVTTDPRSLPDGEITKRMLAFIEEAIRKNPSCYLWSHKRWKWQFDEERHRKLVI